MKLKKDHYDKDQVLINRWHKEGKKHQDILRGIHTRSTSNI